MTDPNRPRNSGQEPPRGRTTLGLWLIGTGRASGFAQFGSTPEAFLGSLAPWLALLIVLGGTIAWSGRPVAGLAFFLVALCNLLAPAVIADALCRFWKRRENWALYANVLNCAQWLILAVILLLLPLASATMLLGASKETAASLLVIGLGGYVMWFHWFTARHALGLSMGRALAVMLCVVFGTAVILQVPVVLAGKTSLDRLSVDAAVQK